MNKKLILTYNEQREEVKTRMEFVSHAEALIMLDAAIEDICKALGVPREQAFSIAWDLWEEGDLFNEMEGESYE